MNTKINNSEKFKTSEERLIEFRKFCSKHYTSGCQDCPIVGSMSNHPTPTKHNIECALKWLDLEYKIPTPNPCPYCRSNDVDVIVHGIPTNKFHVHCNNCGYSSAEGISEEDVVKEHNVMSNTILNGDSHCYMCAKGSANLKLVEELAKASDCIDRIRKFVHDETDDDSMLNPLEAGVESIIRTYKNTVSRNT